MVGPGEKIVPVMFLCHVRNGEWVLEELIARLDRSGKLQTGEHPSFQRREKVDKAITRMGESDSDLKPYSKKKSVCLQRKEALLTTTVNS